MGVSLKELVSLEILGLIETSDVLNVNYQELNPNDLVSECDNQKAAFLRIQNSFNAVGLFDLDIRKAQK